MVSVGVVNASVAAARAACAAAQAMPGTMGRARARACRAETPANGGGMAHVPLPW